MRIPPFIQLVASFLLALLFAQYFELQPFDIPPLTIVVVTFAGVVFLMLSLIHFRRSRTTVNPLTPLRTSTLVTTGIYRITRNPMYVGMTLLLLAWCLALGELSALIPIPIFVITINNIQIKAEETALIKLFGEEYLQYQNAVSRWLFFECGCAENWI